MQWSVFGAVSFLGAVPLRSDTQCWECTWGSSSLAPNVLLEDMGQSFAVTIKLWCFWVSLFSSRGCCSLWFELVQRIWSGVAQKPWIPVVQDAWSPDPHLCLVLCCVPTENTRQLQGAQLWQTHCSSAGTPGKGDGRPCFAQKEVGMSVID